MRGRLRRLVGVSALAGLAGSALCGAAAVGVGFGHLARSGPEYQGGLGQAHAVVRIDHRMRAFPDYDGG